MKINLLRFSISLFVLLVCFHSGKAFAIDEDMVDIDTSVQLYVQNCSGCHTVGGGELTGPDLKDVSTWSQNDLFPAVKRMEKEVGPLTDEEIQSLVDFLKTPDAGERVKAEEAKVSMKFLSQMSPADSELGKELFFGEKSFENKGLACISCHGISDYQGGHLGPDLTGIYKKMGETALVSANEKASFKIMRAAYKDHAITKQEALHLTEFMKKVSEDPKTASEFNPVVWIGSGLALLFFIVLLFIRPKRKKSTRHNLIKKTKKG